MENIHVSPDGKKWFPLICEKENTFVFKCSRPKIKAINMVKRLAAAAIIKAAILPS